ncbi:alpha/beta hydrolase [Microbaculum marinum]|uniref:Alpha/beta hydrolase n=1 Tax=Microbaculum marinum TaxID=1764581 RepID=A0AAW9RIV4_9HYPH
MTDEWMDLGTRSLRYRLEGDGGPLLVLVHEMGGSIETWDEVVPAFTDRFRVLRFDFRGYGQSEKITGAITLEELADDLKALLDALGLDEPAVVAGIAVGAALSAGFAAWYPDRVAGLVLFSPSVGVPPETRADRLVAADAIQANGLRSIARNSFDTGFPERFRAGREADFARFCGRWLGNDPASFAATFRMLALLDIAPVLSAIRCPTLCVGCTDDPLRPPAYVEGIAARIAGASFATIESGHHSAQITPGPVAAAIAGFCETVPGHATGGR